jgi:predicted AlkP superfamily pyrophosphatase or phosphodiesterase
MFRLWMLLAAAFLPFAAPAVSAAPARPKLILVIVVDQFRYDYLIRFRDAYTGGIAKLLKDGATFADARYQQFPTVTAAGHSTMLTGATPSVSGIVSNEWLEHEPFIESKVSCPLTNPPVSVKQAGNKKVESITDDSTCLIGGNPALNGASPRRLLVSTLGDELKMAGRQSKVIGVSLKSRGAILPAGHMADAAYWFAGGKFVTSSYYMNALPAWAEAFNKENPAGKYMTADWLPLDAHPGAVPFCSMAGAKTVDEKQVRPCANIDVTPFANALLEEFAEKVIENESLGNHRDTDILTVSFSANDIVGHAVGPDGPEIRDISIRTDQAIGKLLAFADARLGEGATLAVFTADHGVAPSPRVNHARNMPGEWLDGDAEVKGPIEAALSARFGTANWVLGGSPGMLYLDYSSEPAKKVDAAVLRSAAAEAAAKIRGVARAFTRDDLLRGFDQADRIGRAVALGFYGPRSGDVILLPEPYWMFGGKSIASFQGGTTHLTPYSYDAHVPLIFMGKGIKPRTYYGPVAANDLAPTLAAILEVETPAGSSGRILSEIFE